MTRDLPIYRFDLSKIKLIDNIFKYCFWDFKIPISELEISRAVAEYKFLAPDLVPKQCSRQKHIERIAWFVGFGWRDPILLCNLLPTVNRLHILDGSHRLRAAYVMGATEIKVQLAEDEYSALRLNMIQKLKVSV